MNANFLTYGIKHGEDYSVGLIGNFRLSQQIVGFRTIPGCNTILIQENNVVGKVGKIKYALCLPFSDQVPNCKLWKKYRL